MSSPQWYVVKETTGPGRNTNVRNHYRENKEEAVALLNRRANAYVRHTACIISKDSKERFHARHANDGTWFELELRVEAKDAN
jgi:hypothetical protein